MRIRDLRRFLNPTDARRAIANPRKALRVLRNAATDRATTSIQTPEEIDDERMSALQQLFEVDETSVEATLEELRSGPVARRLETCSSEMEQYPFDLGGARGAGETAYLLVDLLEPESVCEIGVANGVSTLYLLEAATSAGISPDVRAIDRPLFESDVRERRGKRGLQGVGGIIPDSREAGWVAPRPVRATHGYQYYVGDFTEILGDVLAEMKSLELVFYDASKDAAEMELAYTTIIDELQPGGVLLSDDVGVNPTFEETARERDGEWVTFSGIGLFRKSQ